MANENTWINNDGLAVGFGPVTAKDVTTGPVEVKGKYQQLEMPIDVAYGLVSAGSAISSKNTGLNEGATIHSVRYIADVDFDQAVEFGTAQADGTAIDQDGLIASGTTTAEGAGALVGTVVDQVSYIVATPTATAPTVGKGTLIIEYVI